jgi:hypothetical protein
MEAQLEPFQRAMRAIELPEATVKSPATTSSGPAPRSQASSSRTIESTPGNPPKVGTQVGWQAPPLDRGRMPAETV